MEQKLTLNDGTELMNSSVTDDGNILWLYVYADIEFGNLFALLNDPEKVSKITATFGGEKTEYLGFNELFCIRKEKVGFISAGLRK